MAGLCVSHIMTIYGHLAGWLHEHCIVHGNKTWSGRYSYMITTSRMYVHSLSACGQLSML